MIDHSSTAAYQKHEFTTNICKISNYELYYQSIEFFVQEKPLEVRDLIDQIGKGGANDKLDFARVIRILQGKDCLSLIKDLLKTMQASSANKPAINEALNKIYFEDNDFDALYNSI